VLKYSPPYRYSPENEPRYETVGDCSGPLSRGQGTEVIKGAMSRVIVLLITGSVLASCSAVESAGRTVGDFILGNTPKAAAPAPPAPANTASEKPERLDCPEGACPQH
jgi:hypothetical protein